MDSIQLDSLDHDAATIAALAIAGANTDRMDVDAAVIPDGYRLEDLEEFRDQPRRVEETIRAYTLEGFLRYFREYQTPSTVVFGDPLEGNVRAVFDYHDPSDTGSDPQWGDHTLRYSPGKSRQLHAWKRKNGEFMPQADFAHFVEERAEDFADPSAARMLEIARQFEATRNLDFQQATRLDSGDVQFRYEEETQTKGDMEVPETFTIGIPLHKGGDRFELKARFMYRLKSSGLKLGYKLIRLDEAREAAAEDVLSAVEEAAGEADVPVFYADR